MDTPLGPATTIAEAIRHLAAAFAAAGFNTPDLDARFLVLHGAGLASNDLYAARGRPLGPAHEAVATALRRRLAHEPVARILGEWEFWSLPLALGPATLVPRPDTETLVEAALALSLAPRRILDIGTGCGAILIALLGERPDSLGVGTDLSVDALRIARANALRNGVDPRAGFVATSWADTVDTTFDLVVSNPPYIATSVIATLEPDVREHDPHLALDGGADGLDAFRAIIAALPRLLAPGGHVVLECGQDQGEAVKRLLRGAGLATLPSHHDLAGIERAVAARCP